MLSDISLLYDIDRALSGKMIATASCALITTAMCWFQRDQNVSNDSDVIAIPSVQRDLD